jgi:ABC-2 type transport system ATP-binding protein
MLMKTTNPDYAMEAEGISHSFGGTVALKNFTLRVPRGGIYGFLGRNGAGKTTAIKIFAGLIHPQTGSASVLGSIPTELTAEQRQRIGYVSEKQILPVTSKVRNLIQYTSQFYPDWDGELCTRLTTRFRIDLNKKISALSQGGQRQMAFILALAQRPELLILDEPASTLDVVARREFLDEILDLVREGGPTVFFSTHILTDIERVADHIGIIADGSLKVSEPLDELKETVRQVRFHSTQGNLDSISLPETIAVRKSKGELLVTARIRDEALVQEAAKRAQAEYEMQNLSLEDIFVEISRS